MQYGPLRNRSLFAPGSALGEVVHAAERLVVAEYTSWARTERWLPCRACQLPVNWFGRLVVSHSIGRALSRFFLHCHPGIGAFELRIL
ncbi:hypothetical protein BDW69DRAFT_160940 [Aspergillus filifer]